MLLRTDSADSRGGMYDDAARISPVVKNSPAKGDSFSTRVAQSREDTALSGPLAATKANRKTEIKAITAATDSIIISLSTEAQKICLFLLLLLTDIISSLFKVICLTGPAFRNSG